MLPLLGVLVLTLGGGIAVGTRLAGPRVGAVLAEKAIAAAEEKAEASVTLHMVENLVVNPAQSGGSRFVLATIAIEVTSPEVAARLAARDVVIRDAFTLVLASRSVDTLTDIGQRTRLTLELLQAAEVVAGEGKVRRVLIPQFVIQ
jgi:flagellar FliL protein